MTSPLLLAAARAWIYGDQVPWFTACTARGGDVMDAAATYLNDTRETR